MASSDHKVRVFISSTFRDMHAERDHLVTVVFPELRERCERLGLEFFDVDLRWGVPDKNVDGESANSWEYCRKWINEAKPFFICLLGQRYGWEPEPHQLKDEADQQAQAAKRRSITDMEVHHAQENDAHSRRCYFYIRQAQAPDTATEFVDPSPLLAKLDALKARVETCGRPVWHYPCRWSGSGFTDMEAFGKKVLEDLWSGILRDPRYISHEAWQQVLGTDPAKDSRYTDESKPVPADIAEKLIPLAKPPPKNPLEAERDEMQRFADSRLKGFQGRTEELDQLTAFIRDPAADNQPRLAVIAAVSGQGKSALMAKLSQSLTSPSLPVSPSPSLFVITHFVGATSQSSSSYHLVKRLNDELDNSGITFPERPVPEGQAKEEPKLDFQSLCQRLWDRLGDYAGEQRIVILLDALNQLDDGHDLGWLPYRLGPSVRVVVSCIEEAGKKMEGKNNSGNLSATHFSASNAEASPANKVLTALDSRFPKPKRIPLGPLSADDVCTIVKTYFDEYCKELDAPHVDAICDEKKLPQARNPLYLLVLLAELRTLGGNDMNQHVPALIADMGAQHPDTVSLFHWVLQRMEAAEGFGEQAVRWWCLYLALGRVGMSSRELSDLLKRKLGDEAALTAQRIERALRRYLQRRGEQWDFFHGQLRQAVMERCPHSGKWSTQAPERNQEVSDTIRQAHQDIASYFRAFADPAGDKTWKSENPRAFNEAAPHLIGAEQWDGLCAYLTDLLCLERRFILGQVYEVVKDQNAALASLPEFHEKNAQLARRDAAMIAYNKALREYAVVRCGWWLARERGEARPEPPRPELRLELIDEAGAAIPEEHSERAARLRHFANFVSWYLAHLARLPHDVLQLAINWAEGPVAETAERHIRDGGLPVLCRLPRPPPSPLRPQCLRPLEGHGAAVRGVNISPDGRHAISGGRDTTLRVWNLETGQCSQILAGHLDDVNGVRVSPDGQRAVSGSDDKTLRVWNLESGQCLQTLTGHADAVRGVDISPDGRCVLTCSSDTTLRLWNLETGQCLRTLKGHNYAVSGVRVNHDGRHAVSCSSDTTLRVWDLETGQCLRILLGHTGSVRCVSVSPDGCRAISGSDDKTLRVWDLETGQCLRTLEGHADLVWSVSVSPDGRRAVSGGDDYTLRVWDLESGQCLCILENPAGSIRGVNFSPDGRRAVSCSSDTTLRIWDLQTGQCSQILAGHADDVNSVRVSPDGRRAVSGSDDKTLRVWDIESGQCLQTLTGHVDAVRGVDISPDGLRALSGGGAYNGNQDYALRLWDLESGRCLRIFEGHTESVCSVSVIPNRPYAVSGSDDRTLRVWDLKTNQCLKTLLHASWVYCLGVSPDGRLAVSGMSDKILQVWDLQSGKCLRTLEGHADAVISVNVSPDGRHAVSGSSDKTLRVWDLETGLCLRTLEGHTRWVDSVSVSPDGRHAASGSDDKTLRVWDLEICQCLAVYHAGSPVRCVVFTPSGDRIVCGTADGQMHFLTLRNFPPHA